MTSPSPHIYYSTPVSLQAVRAFYGMAPAEITRQFSPDDSVTVERCQPGSEADRYNR